MTKRVFLIILDSVGIGELPDAANFGDAGSNTLGAIRNHPNFYCPNLEALGLFNIEGVGGGVSAPSASFARMREMSMGKDTTIGHWEIAGIVSPQPLPTYPNGFPADLIAEFERRTGRKTICNLPYSGTDVIRDYGDEHCKTGALIVYTSADSVFQIAAHEDIVPVLSNGMNLQSVFALHLEKHSQEEKRPNATAENIRLLKQKINNTK